MEFVKDGEGYKEYKNVTKKEFEEYEGKKIKKSNGNVQLFQEVKKVEPVVKEVVTSKSVLTCEKCGKEAKSAFGLRTHKKYCKAQ